jgi:hypothetical protein
MYQVADVMVKDAFSPETQTKVALDKLLDTTNEMHLRFYSRGVALDWYALSLTLQLVY